MEGWPRENVIDSEDRFDAAIEAFRKRVPITKEEWRKLNTFERENAFTVAKVTNGRVLQDVRDAIDKAVEWGTDFQQFREDVELKLLEEWGGEIPGRAEAIFRTNLITSYTEGRHAIYSSPTVKQARPYLRCDGVDDDRECEICEPFNGVVRPQEDWSDSTPPFHFNAVVGTSKILTDHGEIEASRIHPGMLVATHRKRWRLVTAVLHKPASGKNVRSLKLASGRILRATDEHPILTVSATGGLRWKLCGELQVGDQILEHIDEVAGSTCEMLCDTKDAPALADQPSVADLVRGRTLPSQMVASVDFDIKTLGNEGDVHHVSAETELRDDVGSENAGKQGLFWCEFLAPEASQGCAGLLADSWHLHRVVLDHATGDFWALEPPRPVVLPAPLGDGLWGRRRDACGLPLATGCDTVAPTPEGNQPIGQPQRSLQIPERASVAKVLLGDDGGQGFPGMQEGSFLGCVHASTIITIVDTESSEELCDLSVDGDETYFADGVLVHNCRHQLTPLSADEAEEEGIADELPDVDIDPDFGHAPSKAGTDWDFDLSSMDPELRAAVERSIEEGD